MVNLVKTLEVTKEYVKYFNERDLKGLASLLDPHEVIFTRQSQPTIIGQKVILNRTHKLFKRIQMHGQTLIMVNAIIDLPEAATHPCMIGVLDGEKFAVCILDLNAKGKINNIAILLNKDSVDKARATDREALKAAMVYEKQPERRELEERAKGLRKKEVKLKHRILKEGNTHELALKMSRLQTAKKKLDIQLSRLK